jgi:hypothetical protein
MRWTRRCRETSALMRTAKACGPGRPTLALRSWSDPRTTVAKEPGHRGSKKSAVKTIAQGRPDDPAPPVVTTVCFLTMHTGRGCELGTRTSLRPLFSRDTNAINSGRASLAGMKTFRLSDASAIDPRKPRRTGYRPEPVIGRAFARPVGGYDDLVWRRRPNDVSTSPSVQGLFASRKMGDRSMSSDLPDAGKSASAFLITDRPRPTIVRPRRRSRGRQET